MGTTPSPAPPPELGKGEPPRRILNPDRGCCPEEEADVLLSSCMLVELQEPGASCRDGLLRASLGEFGTHPLDLCGLPPGRLGRGGEACWPAGGTGAPPPLLRGPQGSCREPHGGWDTKGKGPLQERGSGSLHPQRSWRGVPVPLAGLTPPGEKPATEEAPPPRSQAPHLQGDFSR